jgi:hypothetical protein
MVTWPDCCRAVVWRRRIAHFMAIRKQREKARERVREQDTSFHGTPLQTYFLQLGSTF